MLRLNLLLELRWHPNLRQNDDPRQLIHLAEQHHRRRAAFVLLGVGSWDESERATRAQYAHRAHLPGARPPAPAPSSRPLTYPAMHTQLGYATDPLTASQSRDDFGLFIK